MPTKNWIETLAYHFAETPDIAVMDRGDRYALASILYQAAGELAGYVPDRELFNANADEGVELADEQHAERYLWEAVDHGITALLDTLAALQDVIDGPEGGA